MFKYYDPEIFMPGEFVTVVTESGMRGTAALNRLNEVAVVHPGNPEPRYFALGTGLALNSVDRIYTTYTESVPPEFVDKIIGLDKTIKMLQERKDALLDLLEPMTPEIIPDKFKFQGTAGHISPALRSATKAFASGLEVLKEIRKMTAETAEALLDVSYKLTPGKEPGIFAKFLKKDDTKTLYFRITANK